MKLSIEVDVKLSTQTLNVNIDGFVCLVELSFSTI